jgi:hypothetical protein
MRASYHLGEDDTRQNTRLNMTSYLKVVLSAGGAVALLASPVLAKTAHQHGTHAPVPAYERALAAPLAAPPAPRAFVTPYAADLPQPAYTPSVNPDFQLHGNY